jgi:hypothetical protein
MEFLNVFSHMLMKYFDHIQSPLHYLLSRLPPTDSYAKTIPQFYSHVIHNILGIETEFFFKKGNQMHSCIDSYLDPLFCSTGLHICFCACNTKTDFLLLWFCSIVWNWVLWYLRDCSFCSVLPLFLVFFCVSKWTLG